MNVSWNYSKKTEAQRILPIAHHIRTRFYQKQHFCVLPHIVDNSSKVICFPNLPYHKIPNFWERVRKRSSCIGMTDPELLLEMEKLVPNTEYDYTVLKNKWKAIESKLLPMLVDILPGYFDEVEEIEIRPSEYGSVSTALTAWIKDNSRIVVYVRKDCGCSHIVEAILLDRIEKGKRTDHLSWEEREAVIDFLLVDTKLRALFPNYTPTLNKLRESQRGREMTESQKYLGSFGFGTENIFSTENGRINILGKNFIIGNSEKKLMNLLLLKRGRVVNYDEIADALWNDDADEKYSLYAISKAIERLRTKVEENGVYSGIIQTVRGEGYILND